MKKQLLIAAVAATMTSVAFADVSITGGSKVNYTNTDYDLSTKAGTNAFAHDIDLTIIGKTGDTVVSVTMANETADGNTSGTAQGFDLENRFMASKVGDINVKVGSWDNGDDFVSASSRADGKFSANTTIGGVKVTYDAANDKDEAVTLSGSFGGVNASYKDERLGEEIKLSTTVQGVTVAYHADNSDTADSDKSSIAISGTVSGMDITYVSMDADTLAIIEGDSLAGDFEGASDAYDLTANQDVAALKISTAMAGNTIAYTRTNIDGVTAADTTINKFVVTRPLASGATFEATYTSLSDDAAATANDFDKLDLELAVKF